MPDVSDRVVEMPVSATVQLADTASALRRQGVDVIDLSAGRAAEPTPAYVCSAAAAALAAGDTHQTLAHGSVAYRAASVAKLRRENGIEADPDSEIIATLGVKQGLLLSLLATVNPGDEVIIEDPCFVSYESIIRIAGGVPVRVPLCSSHAFRWKARDLEAAITPRTRAIVLNSPHNPTGVVHSTGDLDVVAALARDHDLIVVTDEVYERLTWGREHHSMATRPGMRERTLTVMGLSKTFSMGGWRIGFVFGPERLIEAMVKLQQHLITCPNAFAQAGAACALGDRPRDSVVAMWADWEARCQWMTEAVTLIPGVRCAMPEGAFYAWADIKSLGRTSAMIAQSLLRDVQVAVVPGSAFGPGGEGYLRLTCARSWDDLREAARRLRRALVPDP